MKKKIMFIASSGTSWMGGVYYIKNILFQFLDYIEDKKDWEVLLFLDKSVDDVFAFCKDNPKVKRVYTKKHIWDGKNDFLNRNLAELYRVLFAFVNGVKFIYPTWSKTPGLKNKAVSWIADFQSYVFPEFFTKAELQSREEYFGNIAQNHFKLVLSSRDAFNTYAKLYPDYTDNVYVVPFVSALDEDMLKVDRFDEICKKYEIKDRNFFIVSNQFWKHKNYDLVLEALRDLKEKGFDKIQVLCTGNTKDYRNADYFASLTSKIEEYGIADNIHILGLIPREDQLQLMKNAIAVIQPTLFEGWGTVVEDGKVLGKIILLSDIPVQREQADENCIFFEKDDYEKLGELMKQYWDLYYGKDKQYHFEIKNSKEYGERFFKALLGL